MEQTTVNFILVVLAFVIQCIFFVLGYFLKATITRIEARIKEFEGALRDDAENLEDWKLTYVERHAEIRARVAAVEGHLGGNLASIQGTLNKLASEVPVVCNRLDNIERVIKVSKIPYP